MCIRDRGLTVEANGNTEITIKGIDKVLVGELDVYKRQKYRYWK